MLKQILRLLRRRSVLFIILISSFTYSMVMLFRKPISIRLSYDQDPQDDTIVDIDRVKSRLISVRHNLDLRPETLDGTDVNSIPKNVDFLKEVEAHKDESSLTTTADGSVTSTESCRNSVQGKVLIADDRGYICHRRDLSATGCCSPTKSSTKRYSCETCISNDCCAIYEQCISCCMQPDKKPLLQRYINNNAISMGVIISSITDHFEFCLAKCRTSSLSVHHENSYRDPRAKHCYGESLPVTNTNPVQTSSSSTKDPPKSDKQN